MKATIKGIIHAVGPVELVGASQTKKQGVILMIPGYTDSFGDKQGRDEHWQLDVIGDKVSQLNITSAFVGRRAECEVYITGKEYDKKDGSGKGYLYGVNLAKLTLKEQPQQAAAPQQAAQQPMNVGTAQNHDLPF